MRCFFLVQKIKLNSEQKVKKTLQNTETVKFLSVFDHFVGLVLKGLLQVLIPIDDFGTQFQSSVAFYIETSHVICNVNQMTGFYMTCNIRLKQVNQFVVLKFYTLPLFECLTKYFKILMFFGIIYNVYPLKYLQVYYLICYDWSRGIMLSKLCFDIEMIKVSITLFLIP